MLTTAQKVGERPGRWQVTPHACLLATISHLTASARGHLLRFKAEPRPHKGVGSQLRVRLSCREGRRKEFFFPKGSVLFSDETSGSGRRRSEPSTPGRLREPGSPA